MTGGENDEIENAIRRAIGHLDQLLRSKNPLSKSERNHVLSCKEALLDALHELQMYGDLDVDAQVRVAHLIYEVAELAEKHR